ncbi:unnamed protein product, partial [Brenthis ino]
MSIDERTDERRTFQYNIVPQVFFYSDNMSVMVTLHVTRRTMEMNVDRGRPKKRWIECVRQDKKDEGVNDEIKRLLFREEL